MIALFRITQVTVNVIHSTANACVNQDLWVFVAKSPALKVELFYFFSFENKFTRF
jgi:hypothetical protein